MTEKELMENLQRTLEDAAEYALSTENKPAKVAVTPDEGIKYTEFEITVDAGN